MRQITRQISQEDARWFYENLIQNTDLNVLLGAKFNKMRQLIDAELLNERYF